MQTDEVGSFLGNIAVHTTSGRGASSEELAERALARILSVGANVDPVLREQAEAYKESIRQVLVFYLNEAMRSRNVSLVSKFQQTGHPELVGILDI